MTAKRSSPQVCEARRMASAVQRVTGEWFCQTGNHYTRSEQLTAHGKRICAPCKTRIQKLALKKPGRR